MGDIRNIGSGNIGATNVLRTGSKKLAAATLLLDLAKGLVPVLLAKALFDQPAAMPEPCAALRLLRPWALFWGIASRSGSASRAEKAWPPMPASASASPGQSALPTPLVWLAVAYLSRISSLAGMCAVVAAAIAAACLGLRPMFPRWP